jgi:hypothetical protein
LIIPGGAELKRLFELGRAIVLEWSECGFDVVDAEIVDEEPAAEEPAAEAAACGPVEHPPEQGGQHLIGDQEPPVPYSSTPPTSGWHSSGAFEIAIQPPDDPLSEPRQVSVLEAHAVVVTYRDLEDEDRAALEALVREHYEGRAAVTPYDQLEPGQVGLTAWGTLQLCEGLDVEAVAAFIDEHAAEEPAVPGH